MTEPAARPAVATIAGVEVVTIPLAHYAELLDCQRRFAATDVTPHRFATHHRCRIDRDAEVAIFLTECFGRMLLKEAVSACRTRFGIERSPPPSTVQRFWTRLREAGGSAKPRTKSGGRG